MASKHVLAPYSTKELEYELMLRSQKSIVTVDNYWDCNCRDFYIHSVDIISHCNICGVRVEDQPSSMESEIAYSTSFVTLYLPGKVVLDLVSYKTDISSDSPKDNLLLDYSLRDCLTRYQYMAFRVPDENFHPIVIAVGVGFAGVLLHGSKPEVGTIKNRLSATEQDLLSSHFSEERV